MRLNFLSKFFKKKQQNISFFDLTEKEQIKILEGAAERANKDQMKLVERYNKLYGKSF